MHFGEVRLGATLAPTTDFTELTILREVDNIPTKSKTIHSRNSRMS